VRVHPTGCACDEAACEYSRIRDSFELVRMFDLPESHKLWYQKLNEWLKANPKGPKTPPLLLGCPDTYDDNCVVLAEFRLPDKLDTYIEADDKIYSHRRAI